MRHIEPFPLAEERSAPNVSVLLMGMKIRVLPHKIPTITSSLVAFKMVS